ncbi:indolepyruvate oxidoreductase subunit beta family protein [Pseudovibrio sp. Tun.PSC04-5.I4]|uniref:indolepyruvate oxidoreductase subunit beta family protein n=1 Tax=Pseudovibrio sp. Tun.PSC04-5.I4 TaxID=1798213 RepID=UPI00088372D4|nr:indolepyruvate oxidoreductase subunit beta family protein [Pseudovibrio sp. Tun.PSC04-5.I4]SDQ97565.1 indolepyruvate ferredoxin oxidoreductase beta subunit [Pseudovibrio sp. Tun.PSC04-5.I4]
MNIETGWKALGSGQDSTRTITKIAVFAVGGQGGGVLTDWIVNLAEANGYRAQSTSVAGVAQRTGATIYYVEIAPDTGETPVFSLSPAQGDVDIVICAELMEAGRAVIRGFVTADKTTLIASSHRILAVSEKIVPGNGEQDGSVVLSKLGSASRKLVAFDMESVAASQGSVISSSLFGALAGSGALPFPKASYEDTIRKGGRGVEASLRAFNASMEYVPCESEADEKPVLPADEKSASALNTARGPHTKVAAWKILTRRVEGLPVEAKTMALAGLKKTVDYQDLKYGGLYLDHLERFFAQDNAANGWELTINAAKYLANAMCYDDTIRVADLKTRASRFERVQEDVGQVQGAQLVLTEYFHPRMEEICGTLPIGLAKWIQARPRLFQWLDRRVNKGRRIKTRSIRGFAMLWCVAGLKRWRRRFYRHSIETNHMQAWMQTALTQVTSDYALAVEVLKCRRLIKGYSDTHIRGQSKFDRVLSALSVLKGREDAADWLRRLRDAALLDEKGEALEGALQTIRTL